VPGGGTIDSGGLAALKKDTEPPEGRPGWVVVATRWAPQTLPSPLNHPQDGGKKPAPGGKCRLARGGKQQNGPCRRPATTPAVDQMVRRLWLPARHRHSFRSRPAHTGRGYTGLFYHRTGTVGDGWRRCMLAKPSIPEGHGAGSAFCLIRVRGGPATGRFCEKSQPKGSPGK